MASLARPVTHAPTQRLKITGTQDFAGSYGSVGQYEQLTGTISGEVDPKGPQERHHPGPRRWRPVNANGMVEYYPDFVMLKPKDMSKASGVLRYDAPNRVNIPDHDQPHREPSCEPRSTSSAATCCCTRPARA